MPNTNKTNKLTGEIKQLTNPHGTWVITNCDGEDMGEDGDYTEEGGYVEFDIEAVRSANIDAAESAEKAGLGGEKFSTTYGDLCCTTFGSNIYYNGATRKWLSDDEL